MRRCIPEIENYLRRESFRKLQEFLAPAGEKDTLQFPAKSWFDANGEENIDEFEREMNEGASLR